MDTTPLDREGSYHYRMLYKETGRGYNPAPECDCVDILGCCGTFCRLCRCAPHFAITWKFNSFCDSASHNPYYIWDILASIVFSCKYQHKRNGSLSSTSDMNTSRSPYSVSSSASSSKQTHFRYKTLVSIKWPSGVPINILALTLVGASAVIW